MKAVFIADLLLIGLNAAASILNVGHPGALLSAFIAGALFTFAAQDMVSGAWRKQP